MSSDEGTGLLQTVAAEPAPGQVLDDRYEIIETLGEGGVGVVYGAKRLKLGLHVAIKVLRHTSSTDSEIRLRFEREARAMAALSHPNIVSVTDFGVWDARPYLVMELLEGTTLRQRLREGPMPIEEVLHMMQQFLQGLAYAHSVGLVHRDLKPENIFLQRLPDQLPHVKILDFGFAKLADESMPAHVRDLTRSGVVFGTPAYMSPEQAMGDAMDARTDVYASGVIFFEALTNKRPFEGDFAEMRRLKVSQPAPTATELCPDLKVEPQLAALLRTALATNKGERFADAAAMLDAVRALPRRPAVRRSRVSLRPGQQMVRAALDRPRAMIAAAAVAVAVISLVAFLVLRGPGATDAPDDEAAVAAPSASAAKAPPGKPGAAAKAPAAPPDKPAAPAAAAPQAPVEVPAPAESEAPAQDVPREPESELELAAQAARPAAGNPWKRPGLPSRVEAVRRRALKGQELSEGLLKPVREFARDNREDPRGSLILAYAFANKNWFSDAVERYRMAYMIDPAARGDARMRRDLVRLMVAPKVGRTAQAAVIEIYGQEAIAMIEQSLRKDRLTGAERDTLQGVLDRLRR